MPLVILSLQTNLVVFNRGVTICEVITTLAMTIPGVKGRGNLELGK